MLNDGSYRDHTTMCGDQEVDVFLTNDDAMKEIKLLKDAIGQRDVHLRPTFCRHCNGYHLYSTDPQTTGKMLHIPGKPVGDRKQNNRRDEWSGFKGRKKG